MTRRPGTCVRFVFTAIALPALIAGYGCSVVPPDGGPAQYTSVTAAEAKEVIDAHAGDPDFVILDVRTPAEFAAGHIANAVNINVNGTSPSFAEAIAGLDKSRSYFVYCSSQHRSPTAISAMQQQDFASLYELTGGLAQWLAAGLPLVQ
jgi:phage shock protein E